MGDGGQMMDWDKYLEWYPILKFFEYEHLPERLRPLSQPFHDTAWELVTNVPRSAEAAAGLRHLLEAKDCFVRAAL